MQVIPYRSPRPESHPSPALFAASSVSVLRLSRLFLVDSQRMRRNRNPYYHTLFFLFCKGFL